MPSRETSLHLLVNPENRVHCTRLEYVNYNVELKLATHAFILTVRKARKGQALFQALKATNITLQGSLSWARTQVPDGLVEGLIGTEGAGSEFVLVGIHGGAARP